MDTKLTQEQEDTLQAVAHELEQVAEELRSRALRGRDLGTLADFPRRVRALERQIVGIVK